MASHKVVINRPQATTTPRAMNKLPNVPMVKVGIAFKTIMSAPQTHQRLLFRQEDQASLKTRSISSSRTIRWCEVSLKIRYQQITMESHPLKMRQANLSCSPLVGRWALGVIKSSTHKYSQLWISTKRAPEISSKSRARRNINNPYRVVLKWAPDLTSISHPINSIRAMVIWLLRKAILLKRPKIWTRSTRAVTVKVDTKIKVQCRSSAKSVSVRNFWRIETMDNSM